MFIRLPRNRAGVLRLGLALVLVCGGRRAARGDDSAAGRTVVLPPLLVEDQGSPLRWRYAGFDQFEVLSACRDRMTQEFVDELARLEEQLQWILPPQFRFQTSVPVAYILCDQGMQGRLNEDIPAEMFLDHRPATAAVGWHFVTAPHLGLADQDAYMTFAILDDNFLSRGQMSYLADAMEKLLRQRTPPLPAWFFRGFMTLYQRLVFTVPGGPGFDYESPARKILHRPASRRGIGVVSPPFVWISINEEVNLSARIKQALAQGEPAGSLLVPMAELFGRPNPPAGSKTAVDRYNKSRTAQTALFVRWALDDGRFRSPGDERAWRDRFWKFLERAGTEGVTEPMFRDCLGLGYLEAGEELAHYFQSAVATVGEFGTPVSTEPAISLRDATKAEVARIKGDWERMEIALVKQTYPALSEIYQDHAQRTLWHAFDLGDRDPRLLAAMGLYECDIGKDDGALPWLTAAVQAGVVRPRAYFELARILDHRALAKPLGEGGRLGAGQTAAILAPLKLGRKQSPPLQAACELFAAVWSQSELSPSRPDLEELESEAVLFPRSADLIGQAALLEARAGRRPEANRLLERGLETVSAGPGRARLAEVKGLLANGGNAR